MFKETEKQGKNIDTINEALRLRTQRMLCVSAIFLLVLFIVIAAIVGGLIAKSAHISDVSAKLEESLVRISDVSSKLEENTASRIALTKRLSGIDDRIDGT